MSHRVCFVSGTNDIGINLIVIVPKAFFAVLGIMVPDLTTLSDRNSDPFWMKNTDEFCCCWVCVSFEIKSEKVKQIFRLILNEKQHIFLK